MSSIYDSRIGHIKEVISNQNALIFPWERDKDEVGKILLYTFFKLLNLHICKRSSIPNASNSRDCKRDTYITLVNIHCVHVETNIQRFKPKITTKFHRTQMLSYYPFSLWFHTASIVAYAKATVTITEDI